jgi:hypothetical protein
MKNVLRGQKIIDFIHHHTNQTFDLLCMFFHVVCVCLHLFAEMEGTIDTGKIHENVLRGQKIIDFIHHHTYWTFGLLCMFFHVVCLFTFECVHV